MSREKAPEVSAAQHENALQRIRRLEDQVQAIKQHLAGTLNAPVPEEPAE